MHSYYDSSHDVCYHAFPFPFLNLHANEATVFMNICTCTVYTYLLDAQTCPGVDLILEGVAECPNTRSYICPGEMVQYECGNNISTITVWDEDENPNPALFNCPGNQNLASVGPVAMNEVCGAMTARFINTADGCTWSRVMINATTSLNGTMIRCRDGSSAQGMVLGTEEVVIVGMVTIKECIHATHIHVVVQTIMWYMYPSHDQPSKVYNHT